MKRDISNYFDTTDSKSKSTKLTVADYISEIFHAATQVHIFHLQTTGQGSYAIHMALNDLYEKLPDHADEIVETYQGTYDIVTGYTTKDYSNFSSKDGVIKYLTSLLDCVEKNKTVFTDSDLLNLVDELKSSIKSTLYKLKRLS